jgi:3',5'-cyclic AMP phosphodiesterase CpdA
MRRLSIYVALLTSTAVVAACTNFEQEAVPDTFTPDTTTPDVEESDEDVAEGSGEPDGFVPTTGVFGISTSEYAAPAACPETDIAWPLSIEYCSTAMNPPAWQLPNPGSGGMQNAKPSCGTTSGTETAAPRYVHLSFPETDASTSIGINWMTDGQTFVSDVQFGTTEDNLNLHARGFSFVFDEINTERRSQRVHEARLCGLQPATTYYYRVGGEGGWSDVYSFTTAPAPDSGETFRLAVTGDSRSDTQALWRQALEGIESQGADVLLFTGDAVETGTVMAQWDVFYTQGEPDENFDRFAGMPWIFVHGNHDFLGDAAWSLNSQPRNEQNFWIRYGNTLFVSLDDTGWFLTQELPNEGAREFLIEALEANQDATWRIVAHHKPIYSSGTRHGQDFGLLEAWTPVFDQYNVDLVFSGHEHNYERSLPVRDNEVVTDNGTIYVVAAGVGAPMYDVGRSFWTAESLKTPTYVILDISDTAINATTYDLSGTRVDSFDITR